MKLSILNSNSAVPVLPFKRVKRTMKNLLPVFISGVFMIGFNLSAAAFGFVFSVSVGSQTGALNLWNGWLCYLWHFLQLHRKRKYNAHCYRTPARYKWCIFFQSCKHNKHFDINHYHYGHCAAGHLYFYG